MLPQVFLVLYACLCVATFRVYLAATSRWQWFLLRDLLYLLLGAGVVRGFWTPFRRLWQPADRHDISPPGLSTLLPALCVLLLVGWIGLRVLDWLQRRRTPPGTRPIRRTILATVSLLVLTCCAAAGIGWTGRREAVVAAARIKALRVTRPEPAASEKDVSWVYGQVRAAFLADFEQPLIGRSLLRDSLVYSRYPETEAPAEETGEPEDYLMRRFPESEIFQFFERHARDIQILRNAASSPEAHHVPDVTSGTWQGIEHFGLSETVCRILSEHGHWMLRAGNEFEALDDAVALWSFFEQCLRSLQYEEDYSSGGSLGLALDLFEGCLGSATIEASDLESLELPDLELFAPALWNLNQIEAKSLERGGGNGWTRSNVLGETLDDFLFAGQRLSNARREFADAREFLEANARGEKVDVRGAVIRFSAPDSQSWLAVEVIESVARERLIRTGIALHRYQKAQKAPARELEQLVPAYLPTVPIDPFDSRPLRLKLTPDGGWVVYSVYRNGKDDGGDPLDSDCCKQLDLPFRSKPIR